MNRLSLALLLSGALLATPTAAQQHCSYWQAGHKNAYFGDLHVHTSYSLDAFSYGTRHQPPDAFSFAQGAPLTLASGQTVKLSRPLDFSVVSDHSEFFDTMGECIYPSNGGTLYSSAYCVLARGFLATTWLPLSGGIVQHPPIEPFDNADGGTTPEPDSAWLCQGATDSAACAQARQNVWTNEKLWADQANNACTYTSIPAYEWSAGVSRPYMASQYTSPMLHRIVLFNGTTLPAAPLDYIHYPTPISMLSQLSQVCVPPACDAIAIPHNSNLSQGLMFSLDVQTNGSDGPNAGTEAQLRARYEPLVEIFQHKASSECLVDPADNTADQSCQYENYELAASASQRGRDAPGYVRAGLEKGLGHWLDSKAGGGTPTNPFQYGFVGDTDNHNATPGYVADQDGGVAGEALWYGHASFTDNTPAKRMKPDPTPATILDQRFHNPGGLTGVWAEENTRDSLFAALKRREVYATSGPRMVVSFFQTWDKSFNPCLDPSFPSQLLASGAVPMGSTLTPMPGQTPRLVVFATMEAVPLQQVDFIKLSVDPGTRAVSEQLTAKQSVNPGGDPTLCTYWDDPGYQSQTPTAYYARVYQAPTWRWSHYDCLALKTPTSPSYDPNWALDFPSCYCVPDTGTCSDRHSRERAWTSPVWSLP